MRTLLASVVLVVWSSVILSAAETVAQYPFAGGSPKSTAASKVVASDFQPSEAMAKSAKFADTLVFVPVKATPDSVDTAIEKNSYFSFTVTPASGKPLSLAALNFGTAYYGTGPKAGKAGFFVRSSVDDFAADLAPVIEVSNYHSVSNQMEPGDELPPPLFDAQSVDLSGPAFQKLTKPVEFRIYFFDSALSPARRLAVSEVSVTAKP